MSFSYTWLCTAFTDTGVFVYNTAILA